MPLGSNNNKRLFKILKRKKQPYVVTRKNYKGFNQWALVPLELTIKQKKIMIIKIKTTLICNTEHLQVINPMGNFAPWTDTYLHSCKIEELEELPGIQSMY